MAFAGVCAAVASGGGGGKNPHNKVTICHATGSKSNPFVEITPDASGVIDGHYPHQDHRDIIPPFDYKDSAGNTHHFPGQNWTAQGQAIFNNGCKIPGSTTTGTTTTSPVTTTVTVPGGTTTVVTTGPSTTVTLPATTQTVTTSTTTTSTTKSAPPKKVTVRRKRTVIKRGLVSHKSPQTTG
jgi:hypothetical protein